MTTNGTYKTGLYRNHLIRLGFDVIMPDPFFQEDVIHRMIYDPVFGIKSRNTISPEVEALMLKALLYFRNQGAEAIILGCTEFSLLKEKGGYADGMVMVDSTRAFAHALIAEARVYMPDTVQYPVG
jgi:aspartate racemase